MQWLRSDASLETPSPVTIYTLGRFELLINGTLLRFEGRGPRKPLELLSILVAFGPAGAAVGPITDLLWPQADGFDLIRKLRAEPRYARVPILLISGDSDPHLPVRALEQGADAFFAKPYSPSAIRRKLEQLI